METEEGWTRVTRKQRYENVSRWMMGIKRIEKIRTEEIRAWAGVANISETIREARLRHVERKTEEDATDVVMRR